MRQVRPSEIEAWALSIVDRVRAGQPVEDSLVELKARWPDDVNAAARRLAGHANSARGESILWVIGLDEKVGVVGADAAQTGEWCRRVGSEFDGLPPSYTDVAVPTGGVTLIALLFDTTRAPFVVRNASYGQKGGGPVSREVPWREGTEVRSARREDLVRVLVPLRRLPAVEVMQAHADRIVRAPEVGVVLRADDPNVLVRARLYVLPASPDRIVIAFHRCRGTLHVQGTAVTVPFSRIDLAPPTPLPRNLVLGGERHTSHTILGTSTEIIVDGPGTVELSAAARVNFDELPPVEAFEVVVELRPLDVDVPVTLRVMLGKDPPDAPDALRWIAFEGDPPAAAERVGAEKPAAQAPPVDARPPEHASKGLIAAAETKLAVAAGASHEEVWLYTDGASRGNPGAAAIGLLVLDAKGGRLAEHAECIGTATNNEAEYRALIKGLEACARFTKVRVRCVSDSELMVRQLTGAYRTKEPRLRELRDEVGQMSAAFREVTYSNRPRSDPHISRVDRLVNAALDALGSGTPSGREATDSEEM